MQPETYRLMASVEEVHWWFRARRKILASTLDSLALDADANLLEAGCGTGGNLTMLAGYGRLQAFEPDPQARTVAQGKAGIDVVAGGLPDEVPRDLRNLQLICAFDVLEHVDDDGAAASTLLDRLAPGGALVMTVPAYGWLWSRHDDAVAHKRRYTRPMLRRVLRDAGFTVERCTYFNSLLFPAVAAVRLGRKGLGIEGDGTQEMALPHPLLNRVLHAIFSLEGPLLRITDLPFGVSLLAVARRPED